MDYVGLCVEKILNNLHALTLKVLNFSGMQFNKKVCMLIVNFINLLKGINLIEFVLWCSGTLVTNL